MKNSTGKIHYSTTADNRNVCKVPSTDRKSIVKVLKEMGFGNWFINFLFPGVQKKSLKVNRNSKCTCGSEIKYKKCCGK